MLFLGATPAEVVDLIANSELPEGGKFDRQYPGAREAILVGFTTYGAAYPDSVYAWSRWILPYMKKHIVPAVFKKFDPQDPEHLERVKANQEAVAACEETLRGILEETGGTVPDEPYAYNRALNNLEYAHSSLKKVQEQPEKARASFDNEPVGRLWSSHIDGQGYNTVSQTFHQFQTIKQLADRYNIRINLNEFNNLQDVTNRLMQIEQKVEETEHKRQFREGFKSGQYTWDAKPIYQYKDGWAVWPVSTADDLRLEGEIMHHCIGDEDASHYWRIQQGGSSAVSLRDPHGISHATAELTTDGEYIASLYGYRDHALNDDYAKRMKEYFDQSGVDRDSDYYTSENWAGGGFDDGENRLGDYDDENDREPPEPMREVDDFWSDQDLQPPRWGTRGNESVTEFLQGMSEWADKMDYEGYQPADAGEFMEGDEDLGYDEEDTGFRQEVYYDRPPVEAPLSRRAAPDFAKALMHEVVHGPGTSTHEDTPENNKRDLTRLHSMAKGFLALEGLTNNYDHRRGASDGYISESTWQEALHAAANESNEFTEDEGAKGWDNPDVAYFMSIVTAEDWSSIKDEAPEAYVHPEFNPEDKQDRLFADDEYRHEEDWDRYNTYQDWSEAFPSQNFPAKMEAELPEGTRVRVNNSTGTVLYNNPPYGYLVEWDDGGRNNIPRAELRTLAEGDVEHDQSAMPVDARWFPGTKLMWRGQPVEVIERIVDAGPDQSDWVKVKIVGPGGEANYDVGDEKLLPKKNTEGRELFTDMPPSYPPTLLNEGDRVVMKTDPNLKGTFVQYRNNDPEDQLATVQWDGQDGATSLDDNVLHSDLKAAPLEPGTEMMYNGAPVTVHLDWNDGEHTTEVKSPNGHLFTVDRNDLKPMDYETPVEEGSLVGKKFWYGPGEHQVGGALQVTVEENDDRRARIRMPDGTTGYTLIQSLGDPVEEEGAHQREPMFTPGTSINVNDGGTPTAVEVVEDQGDNIIVRYPQGGEAMFPANLLVPQERPIDDPANDTGYGQPDYQEQWGENHELVGQRYTLGTTPVIIQAVGEAGYARLKPENGGPDLYARLAELTAPQQTDEEWNADYLRRQQTAWDDQPDPEAHADGGKPIEEWASDGSDGFFRVLPNGQRIEYPMGGYEEGQRWPDTINRAGDYVYHQRDDNGQWDWRLEPFDDADETQQRQRDDAIDNAIRNEQQRQQVTEQDMQNTRLPGAYDGEQRGDYVWEADPNMVDGGSWVWAHGRRSKVSAAGQNWVYLNGQVARGAQPHHLLIHRLGEGYDGEPILGQLSNTWMARNGLPQGLAHDVARGHYDSQGRPAIWESNANRNVVWDAVKKANPTAGSPVGGMQAAARSYDKTYEEMYAQLQGMGWDVMSSGPKGGLFAITIKNNATGGQVERTGNTQEAAAAAALTWAWQHSHAKVSFVQPAQGDNVYDSMGGMMPADEYTGEAINSYREHHPEKPRGSILYKHQPDGSIWVDSIYSRDTEGAMELFNHMRKQYPGVKLEGMFMNERLKSLADRYNQGNGHTPLTDQERLDHNGWTTDMVDMIRPYYDNAERHRRSKDDGCRALHQQALDQGWVAKKISNGWMLLSPDGINKATYHLSQSDVRAVKNFRAQLMRGGFQPTDKLSKETNMDLPIATKQTLGQVFASLKPDADDGRKLGLQAYKLGYSMEDLRTFLDFQDEDYQPGFKVFKEAAVSAYASRGWQVESALQLVLWNAITGQRGGPTVNSLAEGKALAEKQMQNTTADGRQIIYRAQVIDPMFPGSPKWDTDDEWEGFKTEDWERIKGQGDKSGWQPGQEIQIQRNESVPVSDDWAFHSSEEVNPDFTFIYYQGALEVEPWAPNLRPNVMLKKILDLTGKEITDYNVDDNKIGAGDIYKRDGDIDVKLNSLCDGDVQQATLDSVHQWAQGMNLIGPIQPPVQHASV